MTYRLPYYPVRSLYAFGIVIIGITLLAFMWFILNVVFEPIQIIGLQMMSNLGTDSADTIAVNSFFTNFATYVLIFCLIVLGFWAFVYTQRKGVVVSEI